jgi:hypothetical protein
MKFEVSFLQGARLLSILSVCAIARLKRQAQQTVCFLFTIWIVGRSIVVVAMQALDVVTYQASFKGKLPGREPPQSSMPVDQLQLVPSGGDSDLRRDQPTTKIFLS